jgi:hypothetical protein
VPSLSGDRGVHCFDAIGADIGFRFSAEFQRRELNQGQKKRAMNPTHVDSFFDFTGN